MSVVIKIEGFYHTFVKLLRTPLFCPCNACWDQGDDKSVILEGYKEKNVLAFGQEVRSILGELAAHRRSPLTLPITPEDH